MASARMKFSRASRRFSAPPRSCSTSARLERRIATLGCVGAHVLLVDGKRAGRDARAPPSDFLFLRGPCSTVARLERPIATYGDGLDFHRFLRWIASAAALRCIVAPSRRFSLRPAGWSGRIRAKSAVPDANMLRMLRPERLLVDGERAGQMRARRFKIFRSAKISQQGRRGWRAARRFRDGPAGNGAPPVSALFAPTAAPRDRRRAQP